MKATVKKAQTGSSSRALSSSDVFALEPLGLGCEKDWGCIWKTYFSLATKNITFSNLIQYQPYFYSYLSPSDEHHPISKTHATSHHHPIHTDRIDSLADKFSVISRSRVLQDSLLLETVE
ncbi:hypothetical protein TNIN_463231 [Trichonephila inaurata madagascariensis]|uniref:Uncharacterized protein n=1 Tax=Trichonephila inaurata madagascariensis TaxID=2747483 RepID=A0A8X7CD92_9ARAC|nr:hypothetical protein TNIN_463231 [Trichonephila inaurata madagascariensis]